MFRRATRNRMTLPNNPTAELALIRAICQDRANFQAALALGAGPGIFAPDGPHGACWQQIAALYERGIDPMPELLPGLGVGLFGGEAITPEQTVALAQEVIGVYTRRQLWLAGNSLKQRAERESASSIINDHRGKLTEIERQYTRAKQPRIGNPADALSTSRAWAIPRTGLGVIDNFVKWTSGELHSIAGDPGSGKTTLLTMIAAAVALENKPVLFVTAETDPTEIQLSMLTQVGREGFDVGFVNRVRFDPTFRIERNIDKVRRMWNETFKDVPITIVKVSGGPQEVVSSVAALATPHLILIDHAYAVVSQSERMIQEHREFIMFFSALLDATQAGNHLTIVANQYTRAGLSETDRGPNAQYGGSGTRNIMSSMLHLRQPSTELLTTSTGFKAVKAEWVKVRVLLVEDEHGKLVDPLGKTTTCWIENRYRRILDSIYQEPEPIPFG